MVEHDPASAEPNRPLGRLWDMRLPYFSLLAVVLLSSCGGNDPVADEAGNAAALPAPATLNVSDPSGAPPPGNSATPAKPAAGNAVAPPASIPAALHGRWGLTPGDCTSTRGDAKGLLTIGAGELRFYESSAIPAGNAKASSDSFSADFAFTGEGQAWTKFQALQLQGDKLIRTESSPMASYTYAHCR